MSENISFSKIGPDIKISKILANPSEGRQIADFILRNYCQKSCSRINQSSTSRVTNQGRCLGPHIINDQGILRQSEGHGVHPECPLFRQRFQF